MAKTTEAVTATYVGGVLGLKKVVNHVSRDGCMETEEHVRLELGPEALFDLSTQMDHISQVAFINANAATRTAFDAAYPPNPEEPALDMNWLDERTRGGQRGHG